MKNARKALLHSLCEMIADAKARNEADKIPCGNFGQLVKDIADKLPWVTIDIIKGSFQNYNLELRNNKQSLLLRENFSEETLVTRSKGCRKEGTCNNATAHQNNTTITLRNKYTVLTWTKETNCAIKKDAKQPTT